VAQPDRWGRLGDGVAERLCDPDIRVGDPRCDEIVLINNVSQGRTLRDVELC